MRFWFFVLSIVVSSLLFPHLSGTALPSGLPHCKRSTVVTGEISEEDIETTHVSIATTIQLSLALHETACFHVQLPPPSPNGSESRSYTYNESLLYTIQYSSLEHHHPVRQEYQFGIPHLSSHCVCDCSGGEDHCQIGHSYRNCTRGSACYTTYHPHQEATGCPLSGDAELCCEVSIEPFKKWRFRAVRLGQPDLVAVFTYKLYSMNNGMWIDVSSNRIFVPLNKGQTFVLGKDKLRLQVSGDKPNRQLSSGMYFLRSNETNIRTGVPVNEMREWDVGKLGWFRRGEKGEWAVRGGWVKLQDAHHTSVSNCKAQKYTDSYNAEGYVAENAKSAAGGRFLNFHLGYPVEELEPWLLKSYLPHHKSSRTVVVTHRTSPYLRLDMRMESKAKLHFFHHSSAFRDFTGAIHLDRHSNTFLNVSFIHAHGTQIGTVYRSDARKAMDVAFSVYMDSTVPSNHSSLLSLPSTVNSSRWVCFYPAGQPDLEQCKWVQYFAKPLDWFVAPHQWSMNQGECDGCNEISVNNFLKYLNPKHWFDGITSGSEALAMIFEVVLYFVVIVVVIAICRKCLCPLLRWTLCTGNNTKKSSSTRRLQPNNEEIS